MTAEAVRKEAKCSKTVKSRCALAHFRLPVYGACRVIVRIWDIPLKPTTRTHVLATGALLCRVRSARYPYIVIALERSGEKG